MKKYIFLLIFLFAFCFDSTAQTTFSRRYDFGFSAVVFNGVALSGDTILVSGIFGDSIYLNETGSFCAMMDSSGALLHIEPTIFLDDNGTFELWANVLAETEDEGYLAVGYAVDSIWNGLIVKYSDTGELLWAQRHPSFLEHQQFFRFSDVLSDGEKIYVTGVDVKHIDSPYQASGILGVLSKDGELISYQRYYDTGWITLLNSIIKQGENEYVLGSFRNKFHLQNQDFDIQCQVYGVDSTGQEQWLWRSPEDELYWEANSIVPTADGGQIVASARGTLVYVNVDNDDVIWDCILFKLNAQHEQEWVTPFRLGMATTATEFNKVISCPDGSGFLAAGIQAVEYIEGGDIDEENAWDIGGYLGKVSPEGDSLWDRLIIHPGLPTFSEYHDIYDLKATPDGGYLLVGQSRSSGTEPSQQGWLVKVDEYGCLVPGCHLLDSTEEVLQEDEMPLLLYPNPVSDMLNVYIGPVPLPDDTQMLIVSMAGKVVQSRPARVDKATYMVDVKNLPAGPYILQLNSRAAGVLASETFIKK
jgi:hypothetical protein